MSEIIESLAEAEKAVSTTIDAIYTELPACIKKLHADYETLKVAWKEWRQFMQLKYKPGAGSKSNTYSFASINLPFSQMTKWLEAGMGNINYRMSLDSPD